MTIETVLFDFGGVIIRTPFELPQPDVAADGTPLDHSTWTGPFDPAADALWRRSMAEEITEREYWHERATEVVGDVEDPTLAYMRELYETDESIVVRPEMAALVAELADAGLRVAVLTNDLTKFHPQEWVDRMTITRRFDPLIDLSHVGFLKPAPQAYEHALKELDADDPSTVLFVDDQPANVEGGRAVGLTCVWFDPTDVPGSIARIHAELPAQP